jgi:hypothetical protein
MTTNSGTTVGKYEERSSVTRIIYCSESFIFVNLNKGSHASIKAITSDKCDGSYDEQRN